MSNELAVISDLVPSSMEQAIDFASRMADANLIPSHLKKSPSDCLRVVLIASRWRMDPFAVADKTSIISGKLMYEGQLVSAVVNTRGNLKRKLSYHYEGAGDDRVLTVSGTIQGEDEPRTIELSFGLAKKINKNGQMGINPDQQASYIGARLWARKHTPELMLGVYTPDEIDPDEPTHQVEKVVGPGAEGQQSSAEKRPDPKDLKKGKKTGTAASEPANAAINIESSPAGEKKADAPKTPEPTKLENGQKLTVKGVQIESAAYENFAAADKPARHGAKVVVSGGFVGTVYDLNGGAAIAGPDGIKTDVLPIWKTKGPVTLEMTAKKSSSLGVIAVVDSIKPDEEELP